MNNLIAKPTPKQAEAGNYKKGHLRLHGLDITIETPRGRSRKPGVFPRLCCDYGYVKRTRGADGDHVDVFVGPSTESELVIVIDQVNQDGTFDEHKCLLGFRTKGDAIAAYRKCYTPDWKVGPAVVMTIDQFKAWLKDGSQKHPIEQQVSKYASAAAIDRWLSIQFQKDQYSERTDGHRWITTETGSHILIDSEGTVKAGAGGKLDGKKLGSAKSDTPEAKPNRPRSIPKKTMQHPGGGIGIDLEGRLPIQQQEQQRPPQKEVVDSSRQVAKKSPVVKDFASSVMERIKAAEQAGPDVDQPSAKDHPLHHSQLDARHERALLDLNGRLHEIVGKVNAMARITANAGGDENAQRESKKKAWEGYEQEVVHAPDIARIRQQLGLPKSINKFEGVDQSQLKSVLGDLTKLINEAGNQGTDLKPYVRFNNIIPRELAAKLKPNDSLFRPVRDNERFAIAIADAISEHYAAQQWNESDHPRDESGRFTVGSRAPRKQLEKLSGQNYKDIHERFKSQMASRRQSMEGDLARMRSEGEAKLAETIENLESQAKKKVDAIENNLDAIIKQIEERYGSDLNDNQHDKMQAEIEQAENIAESLTAKIQAETESLMEKAESDFESLDARLNRMRDKMDEKELNAEGKLEEQLSSVLDAAEDARADELNEIESYYDKVQSMLDKSASDHKERSESLLAQQESLEKRVDDFYDRLHASLTDYSGAASQYAAKAGLLASPASMHELITEYYAARRRNTQPGQQSLFETPMGGRLLRPSETQKRFDWDESKHPRADDGKFAASPGSGATKPQESPSKPDDADELRKRRDYWNSVPVKPDDPKPEPKPIEKPEPAPDPKATQKPALEPATNEDFALDAEPSKDTSPRETAAERQKQLDADYEFARKSSVGNAGEDLKGSARHKRNEWRSLEDAESNGTAEALVTRDNLLKNEPHNLGAHIDRDPLTAIFLQQVLKAFPPKPGYGKQTDKDPAKTRAEYVEAYRSIKDKAESLLKGGSDVTVAQKAMQDHVTGIIRGLREGKYENRYNVTANNLVNLSNNLGRGSSAILGKVGLAVLDYKESLGEISPSDMRDRLAEAAATFMEGGSLESALGKSKSVNRGERFNPADMYVGHAERKGGPKSQVTSAKDATAWMVDKVGIRGVQFGNSVSDDEREHHAKMTADALLDLADVTGLPIEGISLGGKLGLAIGARGVGGALAHYEPGTQVINLTRKNGVGSLAHEWAHALDHSMNGFGKFMTDDTGTHEITLEGPLNKWKLTTSTPEKYKDSKYTVTERPLSAVRKAVTDLSEAQSTYRRRLRTELIKRVNSKQMSAKKADTYWNSDIEIFARTFERFVQHKLESSGRKNSYLSGIETKAYKSGGLWPTDEEVKQMAPAFDALMDAHRKHNLQVEDRVKYSAADRQWIHGLIVEYYAAKKSQESQQEFQWITVHPNSGPGHPVMIDKKDGTIQAGMGGKFNGQKIGEIGKPLKGEAKQATPESKVVSIGELRDEMSRMRQALSDSSSYANANEKSRALDYVKKVADSLSQMMSSRATDRDRERHLSLLEEAESKGWNGAKPEYKQRDWEKAAGDFASDKPEIEKARKSDGNGAKYVPRMVGNAYDEHKEKVAAAINRGESVPETVAKEHGLSTSQPTETAEWQSENGTALSIDKGFNFWNQGVPYSHTKAANKTKIDIAAEHLKAIKQDSVSVKFEHGGDRKLAKNYMERLRKLADASGFELGQEHTRTEQGHKFSGHSVVEFKRNKQTTGANPQTTGPEPVNSGDKPATAKPSDSDYTPPTIPGEQTSLFGGDDMNSGQKSLFNVARPSKADIRASKQQGAPAPASLLEQIDDEQKIYADSRKSLPGQKDMFSIDAQTRHAFIVDHYRAGSGANPKTIGSGNPHGKKGDKATTTIGTFGDKGKFVTIDGRAVFIESKDSVAAKRKKRDDAKAPFVPKTVLDHAIVDYIGNHKKTVEAFKPFIEDAYKHLNSEASGDTDSLREVLSNFGYKGKAASAFIGNLRHKRDYTSIPGFDEMAEYAKKYHPELLAGRTGESTAAGDHEQAFFDRLRQGFTAGYAKHSPEVLEMAAQMAGSSFFDESNWAYDPQQVDDVPFDAYRHATVDRYSSQFADSFIRKYLAQTA
jgi:hypothetical protein